MRRRPATALATGAGAVAFLAPCAGAGAVAFLPPCVGAAVVAFVAFFVRAGIIALLGCFVGATAVVFLAPCAASSAPAGHTIDMTVAHCYTPYCDRQMAWLVMLFWSTQCVCHQGLSRHSAQPPQLSRQAMQCHVAGINASRSASA